VLTGAIRFAPDGSIPDASAAIVDQLARHVVSAWGTRLRIAIARGTDAQVAALAAALAQRGVPERRFEIAADPAAARGVRITVVPAAATPEVGAPHTEAPDAR
jgi:hypothetical protein